MFQESRRLYQDYFDRLSRIEEKFYQLFVKKYAAKTALASLIAHFWDVDAGSILIGGVNIKEVPTDQLMDTVSYVFQDSKLLKTSIMENASKFK